MTPALLAHLNPAQADAVSGPLSHQLVLAGAGSGKTRVLVHRIAWLIQHERVAPYRIMAVTFTNKAAREMRSRIEELLGFQPQGMWVGTFHGLAHRLLRAHWKDAGLPEQFQILDSDDQLRLIKRITQARELDADKWPPRETAWFINGQKDEGIRATYLPDSADPYQATMKQLYLDYEQACERAGAVDFGELLLRAHELWLNNPALLQHYQQRFPFVLVDEFQDTNTIQYAWLRVLIGNSGALTAVGDDDQSIYGWRGAKIENIQQFTQDFSGAQCVKLEQNYRSTGNILSAANAVIENNPNRLGKTLTTDAGLGDPIDLYAAFNEQDEARFIAEQLNKRTEKTDVKRSDCAILYRSNAQSRVLEEALLRTGIPYRIYGGQRFYDRLEIRNALAYMRLALNPLDDAAFERVINTPTRGIGGKTYDAIRDTAQEQGIALWQSARELLKNKVLSSRATNAVAGFLQLIEQLQQAGADLNLGDFAETVLQKTLLIEYHLKEKGEKGQARKENLEELVNACRSYDIQVDNQIDSQSDDLAPTTDDATTVDNTSPLGQFLAEAALDAGESQADAHEDAVQLMTLHSAKGLEFPYVFLAGLEENLFPHRMSADDPYRLEEERRLAYVGITRAMTKLCLTYAEVRRQYGSEHHQTVSRFVKEIPDEVLQEVRMKATISRPAFSGRGANRYGKPNNSQPKISTPRLSDSGADSGFSLGQAVQHPIFGVGTIMRFEGSGSHARVHINFDDHGQKCLVVAYAKLEAI